MTRIQLRRVWAANIKKLTWYKKTHGNFNIPADWEQDRSLAKWVNNIRLHPEKLPKDLKRSLDEIGFQWSVSDDWEYMFSQLKSFYRSHGNSYIPPFEKEYETLFDWVERQRMSRALLSVSQLKKLASVEFEWVKPKDKDLLWINRYKELVAFKQQHGHARVPSTYKNYPLSRWVSKQREIENTMVAWRKSLLTKIGFSWHRDMQALDDQAWESKYQALKLFVKEHGHFKIPSGDKRFHSLRIWVDQQRQKEKIVRKDRKKLLDAIGFPWGKDILAEKENDWQAMYKALVSYRKKHGDAQVSAHSTEHPKLAAWIGRQRKNWDKLTIVQRRLLRKIDFKTSKDIENDSRSAWLKMFAALKHYKAINGNCRVPSKNPKNPMLGRWVEVQRLQKNELAEWKKKSLTSIGFEWSEDLQEIKEKHWNDMYRKLERFYKRYGHSSVPEYWSKDEKLAIWVSYQRKPKAPLSNEKKRLLKKLSFQYKARTAKMRKRNDAGQFLPEV